MANTTNFNWETPDDTDLVKDGAAAIRTLGSAIDTSLVDLKGGTTGQVLSKATNTDMDFTWVAQDDSNAIQNAIIDAKGDLIVGTAADTPARLAVGTNGYVLTADSTATEGVKWAAAAGGGKVLQVVNASTTTSAYTASSTYTDTNLTASITPTSATSKVLVFINQEGVNKNAVNASANATIRLMRGSTSILEPIGAYIGFTNTTVAQSDNSSCTYLDNPATTSATTYKTQFKSTLNNDGVYVQDNGARSTITLMEIGA